VLVDLAVNENQNEIVEHWPDIIGMKAADIHKRYLLPEDGFIVGMQKEHGIQARLSISSRSSFGLGSLMRRLFHH
jgi:hypothetical protein